MFLLLAASVLPYFVDLNGSSIWDANEAFYVETPREMIESGDFISPTFNYQPRLNKPVLSYWIVAGFFTVFGVSVGVQRLPIALAAVMMIVTAFLLARAGADPPRGNHQRSTATESALWAAAGLAVAPRLMMFGRRIFIDIYISMFMALTLLFFALAERYPARRRLFLLLMYAAAGLGVLTKGPVAAALPALVFAIYLVVHGELKRVRHMMIPVGVLVVLAIAVPWYAALYDRYGWTYITSFFVGENIARYTEGLGVESRRGAVLLHPRGLQRLVSLVALPAWRRRSMAVRMARTRQRREAGGETVGTVPDEAQLRRAFARCCGCGCSAPSGSSPFRPRSRTFTFFRSCRPSRRLAAFI